MSTLASADLDYPLDVRPLEPTIGAEIHGIDLGAPINDTLRDAIKAAILKYKVVFFRDQDITRDQHLEFARRFGEIYVHPTGPGVVGHPQLYNIAAVNHPKRAASLGKKPEQFHADTSWRLVPTWGAILRGVTIPDVGGDTIWVDAGAAYEGLSDELKARIEGLFVTHNFRNAFNEVGKDYPIVSHPIARKHPETGQTILWVNFSSEQLTILGLDRAESAELLEIIRNEYKRPEYQVRFKWRTNSVAFWDNRAAVHYAVRDYGDFPRVVERVLIADQAEYADL